MSLAARAQGLEPGCQCLRLDSTRGLRQGPHSASSLGSWDVDLGPPPQPQEKTQTRGQGGAGPDRVARGRPAHQPPFVWPPHDASLSGVSASPGPALAGPTFLTSLLFMGSSVILWKSSSMISFSS